MRLLTFESERDVPAECWDTFFHCGNASGFQLQRFLIINKAFCAILLW